MSLTSSANSASFAPKAPLRSSQEKAFIISNGAGEYAWGARLKAACNRLGLQCITAHLTSPDSDNLIFDQNLKTKHQIEEQIEIEQPTFVVSLKTVEVFSTRVPHYLSATGVEKRLFDLHFEPNKRVLEFDAILTAAPEIRKLENYFKENKNSFHAIPWYPSCGKTEYKKPVPERIFFCGFQWDKKRNGPECRRLFSLLDKENLLDILGPKDKWDCAYNSVKGMTFDENELRLAMQKAGIVLILHDQNSINLGTPAARIFEAAAASCVIICDEHPFVKREFPDSVLFIDSSQSGENLYTQIKNHLTWIYNHPEEVESMTRKAHTTFIEKFTLESQLQSLILMHKELVKARVKLSDCSGQIVPESYERKMPNVDSVNLKMV